MTSSTATPPSTASGGFPSVAVPQRTVEYASGPLGHESPQLQHLATFRDESAMDKGGWRRGRRSGEEDSARTTYLIPEFKLKPTGTGTAGGLVWASFGILAIRGQRGLLTALNSG